MAEAMADSVQKALNSIEHTEFMKRKAKEIKEERDS